MVTLIVAAANIDVVISISLFSAFLGLIFSDGEYNNQFLMIINIVIIMIYTGSIILDAFRAPIEISVGVVYGIFCGVVLWFLPTGQHVIIAFDIISPSSLIALFLLASSLSSLPLSL